MVWTSWRIRELRGDRDPVSLTLTWALQTFIVQLFANTWSGDPQGRHVGGVTNG
jgi:hypothetical protein